MAIKSLIHTFAMVAACMLLPLSTAFAYPTKPITLVVPFPPGGGNDQIGRLVAERLGAELNVQVIVENKGGAGGNIGAAFVARANPDGYTLAVASNQVVINASLYSNVGFDLRKDLRSVAMVADVQFLLVSHPGSGLTTTQAIVEKAKAGSVITHGTPGNGTPQHLSAELFSSLTGAPLTHVPYRGSGPAIADVLGGHIDLAFATLPAVAPHVKAQKLTGVAVTGTARSPLLPNVPTIAESGVAGYESSTWYGLLAPAKTPDATIAILSDALKRIVASDTFRTQLDQLGYQARFLDFNQMATVMNEDEAKWAQIIRSANIKVE